MAVETQKREAALVLGARFGTFTVTDVLSKSMAIVQCSCGKKRRLGLNALRRDPWRGCSLDCPQRDTWKAERALEAGFRPGMRFGSLTVTTAFELSRIELRCDCGKVVVRRAHNLSRTARCSSACPTKEPPPYKKDFPPGTQIGPLMITEIHNTHSIKLRCACGREITRSAKDLRKMAKRPLIGCSRECAARKAEHARREGFIPGTQFGVYTVIAAPSVQVIRVRCACGREGVRTGQMLRKRPGKCSTKCAFHKITWKTWVGRRFGRLTALEYVGGRKWLCWCSCGNPHTADQSNLRSGRVRSCGCLVQEFNKRRTPASSDNRLRVQHAGSPA